MRAIILFLLMLCCVSCIDNVAFVSVLDMPVGRAWSRDDRVEFIFTTKDTVSEHRIDLILRHARNFSCSELTLEVTTLTPELLFWRDTVRLRLTENGDKWNGQDFDTHYDFGINYRRAVRFAKGGEYVIKIKHLEPKDSLYGVKALGVIIEKDGKE